MTENLKKTKNLDEMVLKKTKKFRLVIQKGVYPYEYMDSWAKYKETKLPPKNAFYSKLNMKGICDNVYEHAQQVWRKRQ